MMPEEFIKKNIFDQLAIRGYSRATCESSAADAVNVFKRHELESGVSFPELLKHQMTKAGKPTVNGEWQQRLFDAIKANKVTVTRKKPTQKSWCVTFGPNLSRNFGPVVIARFLDAGLLEMSKDELSLTPASDLDWIPSTEATQ